MALSPAEKSRRYRERKAGVTATAPVTATDDIPFNSVTATATGATVTATATEPASLSEQLQNATATITATVTAFAQQHRRWIADMTDRIAVMENLILELAQSHNQLRDELRNPVARYRDETPDATATVTKPERPPSKLLPAGYRPTGSVVTGSLKNLPQPPMDNPHGRNPEDFQNGDK